MKLFIVAPSAEPPQANDPPTLTVDLALGGLYFFLYPFFLRLRDDTGELIDPSQFMAHFRNDQLEDVLRQLEAARGLARRQPGNFQQQVGRQFSPVCEELYETVTKEEVLELIETLVGAVAKAKDLGNDVYFLGH